MAGIVEDLIRRSLFADASGIHDDDFIAQLRDNSEVMGDHNDRHSDLALDIFHKFQNTGLDRNVQRGRRLVRDQDIGLTGKRHCDHDPLSHTARQLMRILFHTLLGIVDIDEPQHFHSSVPGLLFISVCVEMDRFHELLSDRICRVKACHRVLEDDRDPVSPYFLQNLLACSYKFLAIQFDGAGYDLTCCRQDLHDRISSDRLTGA